jgi:hypothetical protein
MPRLLHTADWQIGRALCQLRPRRRRAAGRSPLRGRRAAGRAGHRHAVDAVLVAGDVFDAQTVSARSIRRLFNALEGFAGPWVMIPATTTPRWPRACGPTPQRLGAVPAELCTWRCSPGAGTAERCAWRAGRTADAAPHPRRPDRRGSTAAPPPKAGCASAWPTARCRACWPRTSTRPTRSRPIARPRASTTWRWATGTAHGASTSAPGTAARPNPTASGPTTPGRRCW